MRKSLSVLLSLSIAGMLLGGCGLDEIHSGDAFQAAFPDEDTLTIQTRSLDQQQSGLSSTRQALVGDRADLHDLSFAVAFEINFHARNILEVLWFITRLPPTAAAAEQGTVGDPGEEFHYDAWATWGPFDDDEGKDLEYVLHAWRGVDDEDGRRTFLFFAAARPEGAGEQAWVPFLLGGAKPFDGHADRSGMVQLDMDAIASLDPTEDDVGVISFVYLQQADAHAVVATGEDVWTDDEQTLRGDPNYFYGRSRQGYAVVEFQTQGDLDDDAGDALEDLLVTTGWLYNGDGRCDARVSGGDLGAGSASLTECWDRDHIQDYFLFTTEGLDEDVTVEDGTVADCFSAEPLELPEIDYQAIRAAFE